MESFDRSILVLFLFRYVDTMIFLPCIEYQLPYFSWNLPCCILFLTVVYTRGTGAITDEFSSLLSFANQLLSNELRVSFHLMNWLVILSLALNLCIHFNYETSFGFCITAFSRILRPYMFNGSNLCQVYQEMWCKLGKWRILPNSQREYITLHQSHICKRWNTCNWTVSHFICW